MDWIWSLLGWAVLIIIPSAVVWGIGNAVFGRETLKEKRARKKRKKERKMEGGDEK